MENNIEEINFAEYAKILIQNKNIILLCFFVGILSGLAVAFLTPLSQTYQAQVLIKIGNVSNGANTVIIYTVPQLKNEIDYSLSQKYPSLKASGVSDALVRVTNLSFDKEEAEKGISEVIPIISFEDDNFKARIQAEINKLKESINLVRFQGQQTFSMNLKLLDLQNLSDSFMPSKISKEPTVLSKKEINIIFYLILGGFSGLLIGLAIIFGKEWWIKNRKKII